MDQALHEYVVSNYNLYSNPDIDPSRQACITRFDGQSRETRELVLEASVIPINQDFEFFGRKKLKYQHSISLLDGQYRHNFELADNTSETCADDEYIFDAPFSDWYDIMFTNHPALNAIRSDENLNGDETSQCQFAIKLAGIFDDSREFTLTRKYGRRRPLGGEASGTAMNNTVNNDPINGLQAATASRFLTDNRSGSWGYNNQNDVADDYPHDSAKSYPSGHSAQSWGLAMVLSQIKPAKIKDYMREAWKFGMCRSIGRYHWNSDILYGRLTSLMILPVINAMNGSGFHDGYNLLRSSVGLSGTTISGGSQIGGDTEGGSPSGDKVIKVRLTNSTSASAHLGGVFIYVIPKPDVTECYVNVNDTIHCGLEDQLGIDVTLGPGESELFTYDATPYIEYLKTTGYMTGETIYWQNGPSHDGSDAVKLYTYPYNDSHHWAEDYTASPLSGEINYSQEYNLTLVNK